MLDTIIKRFEQPDEVRQMPKGRFELVHLGGLTIGRATYEPGWRWSTHVAPQVGASQLELRKIFASSGTGETRRRAATG